MGKKILILIFVVTCTLMGMAHFRNSKPEIVYQAIVVPQMPVKATGLYTTEMSKVVLPPIIEAEEPKVEQDKPPTIRKPVKRKQNKQTVITNGYPKISEKTLDMIAPIQKQSIVELSSKESQ